MARLTRQELKKDELAIRLASIQEFFLEKRESLIRSALLALVIAAVGVGGTLLINAWRSKASKAFAAALATVHAPVTQTPANPAAQHFKTDTEKYQQALKEFNEVADKFSWIFQGKAARYYAGLCKRELGNLAEAEKDLTTVAGERNKELASLAKMALGGIYEQTGRNDQAEKVYRELVQHPTDIVPKARAELALANLYQRSKPAEAKTLYQQIQKEYPGGTAGDIASQMLEAP